MADDLLGDAWICLRFTFASVSQNRNRTRTVHIQFDTRERHVWFEAKGAEARMVLDGPPSPWQGYRWSRILDISAPQARFELPIW